MYVDHFCTKIFVQIFAVFKIKSKNIKRRKYIRFYCDVNFRGVPLKIPMYYYPPSIENVVILI